MSDIGNTYIVSDNVYIRIISDCGKIYYAINDRILQCSSTRHIIFTNPIDGTEYIVDTYPGNYDQDHIINIPEFDIWEIRTLNPIIDKYLTNCEVDTSQFENSFESYEKDYYHSYFYAMDRVFRNTWNSKMCCTEKWNYNSKIYKSESFCKCKKVIGRNEINILQYYGLKSRVFSIYWCMVWISENISRILHRKYRGKEK